MSLAATARTILLVSLAACGGRQTRAAPPTSEVERERVSTISSDDAYAPDAGELPPPDLVDAAPADAGLELAEPAPQQASSPTSESTSADADGAALLRRGRAAYDRVCQTCHEDGPRIVGRHLSEARVRRQVRHGGRRMRPIPRGRLGDDDLEALCAFLEGR